MERASVRTRPPHGLLPARATGITFTGEFDIKASSTRPPVRVFGVLQTIFTGRAVRQIDRMVFEQGLCRVALGL